MAASIKDVAAMAGVSIATVSRALNAPDRVSPATLDAVRRAVAALGFRLSRIGQQLRGDRSRLIGVVLPSIASPVFAECVEGIEAGAMAAGYQILLMSTAYDAEREQAALDTLLRQRVDGLILTVAHAHKHSMLDELERANVPYILVYNQCAHRPCVSVDNRAAARDGVAALIAAGHRRIVMLSGAMVASDRAGQRYQGYRDALAAAALPAAPAIEIDFNSVTLPPQTLAALCDPITRPDALFCGNDRLAMLVMRQLQQAGLVLPRDIAVLGFDGLEVGTLMTPCLASVSQPNPRLGATAMHNLAVAIQHGTPPVSTILPHSLRLGGSAASPFAVPYPGVQPCSVSVCVS